MDTISRARQRNIEAKLDLLSVPQICEETGLHSNTVRGYIRSGQLPAVKIGPRMVRVRRADLEEFLTPYEAEASVWARPVR